MIYTIISDFNENRIEAKNRDCRIIRQPLSLLPSEISEYIENTKNASVRTERKLAYTTLLCSLKAFFDIESCSILRNEYGKPYIENSNIHFSISHSDGVIAVCLSDEGEVGIDLQGEILPEKVSRLEKRYFTDLMVKNDNLNIEYYFCQIKDSEAIIEAIDLPASTTDSFTSKWAVAESLMKLSGKGFGDVNNLSDILKTAKTEVASIKLDKNYTLAVSMER